MRTKVTENGVHIPKAWLEGIDEVEIQKEQNMIIRTACRIPLWSNSGGIKIVLNLPWVASL